MISPLTGGLRVAEIHANANPCFQELKLILMMAIAASKATASPGYRKNEHASRANCLKLKEIRKNRAGRREPAFDLRQSLNYLKAKITGEA
jgi:hypothetical protein